MTVRVLPGDCRQVLPTLAAASIDAIVTDPPYGLGFMGKQWDTGQAAFDPAFWGEALRVLKPGGHLLAFGGTRTYHRLACAIEDAGFEIRDQIGWAFGSGFPKSHDVSKGIDRRREWSALPNLQAAIKAARVALGISQSEAARRCGMIGPGESLGGGGFMWFETGMRAPTRELWPRLKAALEMGDSFDGCFEEAEREVIRERTMVQGGGASLQLRMGPRREVRADITAPATDAAAQWAGWGTALKPAWEPIVVARKPLAGTVAANVLAHGTGALNIDGCRVGTEPTARTNRAEMGYGGGNLAAEYETGSAAGRWPANFIHDGSAEVLAAFPEAGGGFGKSGGSPDGKGIYGAGFPRGNMATVGFGDSGSAARFFYCAKADEADRLGSRHPTVKPVDLIAYLCRLVTPPRGLILDPFAGSGTTGSACLREGFDCILIEREPEYIADIERRLAHVSGADAPLFAL